jgi:hypothetical protein
MAGNVETHAQKNRFKPKNQKTKKWNNAAIKQKTTASLASSKASGATHSHKINDQDPITASQGLRSQWLALRGP